MPAFDLYNSGIAAHSVSAGAVFAGEEEASEYYSAC